MMEREIMDDFQLFVSKHELFCLDTRSTEQKYRLVSNKCDIEINESVKIFIDYIKKNEGITYSLLINQLKQDYGIEEDKIKKIIDQLRAKNIVTSEKNDNEQTAYHRNPSGQLWLRYKLIDTEKNKKFFSFFGFAFSKIFIAVSILIFFIVDITFWALYKNNSWKNELIYFSSYDYIYILIFSFFMTLIHETGHISAAIRYGSKTGGIGVAIYYYFPVAWADIHESWNLKHTQRMMVSIGGVYFNIILLIPFIVLCIIFKSRSMADFIIASHFLAFFIFNPFLRMDGYWFLSDMIGVPNLKTKINIYIRECLPSLLFNKKNKRNKRNILSTYTKKTRIIVLIYAILSVIFMTLFMGLLMYYGIKILLNFNTEFIDKVIILTKSENSLTIKQNINLLIRNTLIIVAFSRILWSYSKKLVKFILL